jgi:hypothetical protein
MPGFHMGKSANLKGAVNVNVEKLEKWAMSLVGATMPDGSIKKNPPNPYSRINDTETYAERQARVKAQTQRDEEAAASGKAKRLALWEAYAERLAQAKVNPDQARADFDVLGELMAETTDREELVTLGRKRADLAPYTGNSYVYKNHCWYDRHPISSAIHARCPYCGWYICSTCGSCSPTCDKTYHPFHDEAVDPFPPDYSDDLS